MAPDMKSLELAAAEVARSIPKELSEGKINVGLYGLGFLGKWAFCRLIEAGVGIAACYDANPAVSGTDFEGVPVYSADQIEQTQPEFMLIAARHAVAPVSTTLKQHGIAHASYDAWHVASNFDDFRQVHDHILSDDKSKSVLRSVVMAMLSGQEQYCLAAFEKDQYFCLPNFCGADSEIYVDAGAFAGDSLERFVWAQNGVFSKIYAFEPGVRQFAALQARTDRLIREWALEPASIELINGGLGEADYLVSAASNSGPITNFTIRSEAGAIHEEVSIYSLDRFLEGRRITFLKADVEGMEMALLQGARATIFRHKPKIAICVYHYPTDIPAIANFIANLVPNYRFALHHHSPRLMETVLYCWLD